MFWTSCALTYTLVISEVFDGIWATSTSTQTFSTQRISASRGVSPVLSESVQASTILLVIGGACMDGSQNEANLRTIWHYWTNSLLFSSFQSLQVSLPLYKLFDYLKGSLNLKPCHQQCCLAVLILFWFGTAEGGVVLLVRQLVRAAPSEVQIVNSRSTVAFTFIFIL